MIAELDRCADAVAVTGRSTLAGAILSRLQVAVRKRRRDAPGAAETRLAIPSG